MAIREPRFHGVVIVSTGRLHNVLGALFHMIGVHARGAEGAVRAEVVHDDRVSRLGLHAQHVVVLD